MKKTKSKFIMVPCLSVLLCLLTFIPLVVAPAAAADTPLEVMTNSASAITINSAILNGNLTSMGNATSVNVWFEWGTTTSYGNNTPTKILTSPGLFTVTLNGISPGTTYHFRAKADGGIDGIVTGDDKIFTAATRPPVVRTSMETNVVGNGAVLNGYLDSLGTASSVDVYFEYGKTTNYGSVTSKKRLTTTGAFSVSITGLTPDTVYHFRAKADGGVHGTGTGTDIDFNTPEVTPPEVHTLSANSVTATSATLVGNIFTTGSATSVTVCFEYGVTTNYGTTSSKKTVSGAVYTGGFSIDITDLTPGTTYHFRAKADGGVNGIGYGEDMTFTTSGVTPLTPPMISTYGATGIATSTVTLNGELLYIGTASSVDVFFEYGTTTDYDSSTAALKMDSTGNFSIEATGLIPGQTYHFRAKADAGAHGVATGSDMTFKAATISPTIDTSAATEITNNTAILNGYVVDLGSATTAEASFEYGTTDNYGITTFTKTMTEEGTFSINLTGLKPDTTYHFRAKVDGGLSGMVMGEDMTFTTLSLAKIDILAGSSLIINPPETGIGTDISITATVSNTGGTAGTYQLVLKINGLIEQTQKATLEAGASQAITFKVSKNIAGTYDVDVNGLTGSFTVIGSTTSITSTTALPTTTTSEGDQTVSNLRIIAIAAGAVIVIGLLIYVIRRR